jgi:hypothetical protein
MTRLSYILSSPYHIRPGEGRRSRTRTPTQPLFPHRTAQFAGAQPVPLSAVLHGSNLHDAKRIRRLALTSALAAGAWVSEKLADEDCFDFCGPGSRAEVFMSFSWPNSNYPYIRNIPLDGVLYGGVDNLRWGCAIRKMDI